MSARRWLQHLHALSATIRRCFLHALFRNPLNSRRLFVPPAPRPGATPHAPCGIDELTRRDDCAIRLISTPAPHLDQHLAAPLSQLPQDASSAEIVNVVERLHALASRGGFPLDDYWRAVRAGLADADEWVHYGIASRPAALDAFLTLPAAPVETPREEVTAIFVIHCSRENS